MKKTLMVSFFVAGLIFLSLSVYSQQGDPDNGAVLYAERCASCHGSAGEGGFGPTLIGCSVCDSFDSLEEKIENDMPLGNSQNCTGTCSSDTAAYIYEEFNGNVLVDPLEDPIPGSIEQGAVAVDLETVASGLAAPLEMKSAGDGTDRLFIVDQAGRVYILSGGEIEAEPFLDVSGRLVTLGILGTHDENDYDERGLLGLAFHPGFADPASPGYRKVYTYTSEPVSGAADFTTPALPDGVDFDHQSVVAEWNVDAADPNRVDPDSRRAILRVDQPQFNHNGGMMVFGPDGYLYIAFGDGGAANDSGDGHGEDGNGQNTSTVHGSILRIDPVSPSASTGSANPVSANGAYRVPAGNPFAATDGLDEIFAYGFRNPYRFSFDSVTGRLIVGDVGQNDIEEVNIVVAGGNYGWNLKEGAFRFDPDAGEVYEDTSGLPADLVDPATQYDHDEGRSIIGGYIYRGGAISDLAGMYVFGDFSTSFTSPAGRLFYTNLDNGVIYEFVTDNPVDYFIKGFGIDDSGEIYVLASANLGPYGTGGVVLRIVADTDEDGDDDDDDDDDGGGIDWSCFVNAAGGR